MYKVRIYIDEVEEVQQVSDHIHQVCYRVTGMFICVFLGLHVNDVMVYGMIETYHEWYGIWLRHMVWGTWLDECIFYVGIKLVEA